MQADGFDCTLDIPGEDESDGISVGIGYVAYDAEGDTGSVALAVDFKGIYAAIEGMRDHNEDGSTVVCASVLYFLNDEKPLASTFTCLSYDEAATLSLSTEGREIVALESLFGDKGENVITSLLMDAIFAGFGIVSAATEAVPEFADLMALLSAEGEAEVKAEAA